MPNAAVFVAALASIVLDGRRQVATVRAGELKHPPNWVRQETGTKEERLALARSYQARPINLILVSPDGTIRDGNRRVAAILEDTGPETPVQVCVTDEEITPAVMLEIQIETAEHTKPLTPYEQYVAYSSWLELNPGATAKTLADRIHRHESMVAKILSLAKCIPEVREAAKAGKVGISGWYQCSKSPEQVATLSLLLGGATREQVAKTARKPKAEAVRAAKIKCPLPSGQVITVSGEEISLEEAIESLTEAAKLMKAAVAKGLNAKTAQSVWRDVAAAN